MKLLGWDINISKSETSKAAPTATANTTLTNINLQNRATLLARVFNAFPYTSYSAFRNTPYWQDLSGGLQLLFRWYHSNPVFNTIVSIKAREGANMKMVVENINTGQIEPESTKKAIPAKVYSLLKKPNPNQTTWAFLRQRKIFREVAGNSFTYANYPFKKDIMQISTLNNVWPAYMQFKTTGKYFEATNMADIIKGWRFEYGSYKKEWSTEQILHQAEPNTDPKDGLIFGIPKAYGLIRPLTNIDLAYETRNVIMQNRGMRGVVSPNKSDADGTIPLTEEEKEHVEEALKKYGTLEEQIQFLFSHVPLSVETVDQDVRKLGLSEEVAENMMICAHVFGVPDILVKLALQGTTFENQESSLRRLYQGTLIPESNEDLDGLNEFLGLNQTDWRIRGYWDHIPCLQESEAKKAESNERISKYMRELFMIGGVTLNGWLDAIGMQKVPDGDLFIYQMSEQRQQFIMSAMKVGPVNTGEQAQPAAAKNLNGHQKDMVFN